MWLRALEKPNYVYIADNYKNGKGGGRKDERKEGRKKERKMRRKKKGNARQSITFVFRRISM
jgi:hypothetical protein